MIIFFSSDDIDDEFKFESYEEVLENTASVFNETISKELTENGDIIYSENEASSGNDTSEISYNFHLDISKKTKGKKNYQIYSLHEALMHFCISFNYRRIKIKC